MKTILIFTFLTFLTLTTFLHGEDALKFEDYKKLSPEERQKVIQNASPYLKKHYSNWDKLISMYGQWWKYREPSLFSDKKGFSEIGGLFNTQTNLWGNYEQSILETNRKSGMPIEKQEAVFKALEKESNAIGKEFYTDSWWYLVKLAPTPEALALNEKAKSLMMELDKRFPYGQDWVITRKDMDDINASVNEIRKQMRKLPQLTSDQVEAGFAALPDEHEHR